MTYIVDHLGQMEPASSWLGLTRKQADQALRASGKRLPLMRDVDRVVDIGIGMVITGYLLPEDYV